jgi:hypothetical protein
LRKIFPGHIDHALKRMTLLREPPLQRSATHREFRCDGRHRGHTFAEYIRNGAPYPKLEVLLLCERRQLLLEMAIKKSSDRLVTESIWGIDTLFTDQERIAPGFKVNRAAEMRFIHRDIASRRMLEMDRQRHEGPVLTSLLIVSTADQARFVRQQHTHPAIAGLFKVKKQTVGVFSSE